MHPLRVGWRNFFSSSSTLHGWMVDSARIWLVIHVKTISDFLRVFLLNPNILLVHRNRYSEGMDDGQKTPRGHPDFNSYVKIQRVFIDNGRTDERTETYTRFAWVGGTFFPVVLFTTSQKRKTKHLGVCRSLNSFTTSQKCRPTHFRVCRLLKMHSLK